MIMPMQEELKDLNEVNQDDSDWTVEAVIAAAKTHEKKVNGKVATINKTRSKGKNIGFYGSWSESEKELMDAAEINFVQSAAQGIQLSDFNQFKTEMRNETQALVQTSVSATKTEIVGDVQSMFTSLEKKMDAHHALPVTQPHQQHLARELTEVVSMPGLVALAKEATADSSSREATGSKTMDQSQEEDQRELAMLHSAQVATGSFHQAQADALAISATSQDTRSCAAHTSTTRSMLRRSRLLSEGCREASTT